MRQLVAARHLIREWTIRNIRARYQQSLLGWLWAVVQPAASAVILAVVFTRVVPIDTGPVPYVVFVFAALVPWTLLAASLTDMTGALVQNMNLVTKVAFPREVLPLAAMLARLIDFGVAAVVLALLVWGAGPPVRPLMWLWLPVVLGVQLALVAGIGLISAALNVFYRDVQSVLTLGLQLWFYVSPVLYPVAFVPRSLRWLYSGNPMTGILESYREVILGGASPGLPLLAAGCTAAVVLSVGYAFFKRVEWRFADMI